MNTFPSLLSRDPHHVGFILYVSQLWDLAVILCKFCGSWIQKTYKFCPRCAAKVESDSSPHAETQSVAMNSPGQADSTSSFDNNGDDTPDDKAKKPCSFVQFMSKTSEERQAMSFRLKAKKSKKIEEEEVAINTGVMVEESG